MKPFEKAKAVVPEMLIQDLMLARQCSREEAEKEIRSAYEGKEIWLNDVYQVIVSAAPVLSEGWPEMVWLSIKRIDREPVHDWRDLQEIKNKLVGPECEGVELYPAESRMVDTANQYHLFVLKDPEVRFPFGFGERSVSETALGSSKQRPFSKERG